MKKTKAEKPPRPAPEALALRKGYTAAFYRDNKGMMALAGGMTLMLSLFNLAVSFLLKILLDIASGGTVEQLIQAAWWSLAAFAFFILAYAIQRQTLPRYLQRAMTQYKETAFAEITRKSIGSFKGESAGTYISALTNDAASVQTNYLARQFALMIHLANLLGALAMMLYFSPILTGAALALSLIPVVVSVVFGKRLAAKEKLVSDKNEGFVRQTKDILSGFSVVKSFKAEKEIINLFNRSNRDLELSIRDRRMTQDLITLFSTAAGIIAQMGVFIFGAWLAVTGKGVTPGVVLIFVQLMNFVIAPIGEVPGILANRKAALALIDKLAVTIGKNVRTQGKPVPAVLREGVFVENLSYRYEEGEAVLNNLTQHFKAGQSYALVGGSGSGKSTLLTLLMGSSDRYEGSIRFDGEELREISDESLYDLVSLVQQDVFVFDSTIRENITLFKKFDDESVDRAIRLSGLHDFIKRRGEDASCGENGSELSGGERQRISIARCLLRSTPLLLVDEATAALDAATAFEVTNSILDIAGLTRIIVTHRLEEKLMRRYDEIVVLKNGTVFERGSFDELMAKRGYFYALYTLSEA
jgi:ABC-type multidrug transport system fused ATPase/permease subunit